MWRWPLVCFGVSILSPWWARHQFLGIYNAASHVLVIKESVFGENFASSGGICPTLSQFKFRFRAGQGMGKLSFRAVNPTPALSLCCHKPNLEGAHYVMLSPSRPRPVQ